MVAADRRSTKPDEFERFANAFKAEAHLRQHLRTLLTRMGRDEVRITHGTQEKGKDIVFYAFGGMNERAPYACVGKKNRITGSISDRSSAKEVLEQAEQAFDEPYTNPNNGQHEQIKRLHYQPIRYSGVGRRISAVTAGATGPYNRVLLRNPADGFVRDTLERLSAL